MPGIVVSVMRVRSLLFESGYRLLLVFGRGEKEGYRGQRSSRWLKDQVEYGQRCFGSHV